MTQKVNLGFELRQLFPQGCRIGQRQRRSIVELPGRKLNLPDAFITFQIQR